MRSSLYWSVLSKFIATVFTLFALTEIFAQNTYQHFTTPILIEAGQSAPAGSYTISVFTFDCDVAVVDVSDGITTESQIFISKDKVVFTHNGQFGLIYLGGSDCEIPGSQNPINRPTPLGIGVGDAEFTYLLPFPEEIIAPDSISAEAGRISNFTSTRNLFSAGFLFEENESTAPFNGWQFYTDSTVLGVEVPSSQPRTDYSFWTKIASDSSFVQRLKTAVIDPAPDFNFDSLLFSQYNFPVGEDDTVGTVLGNLYKEGQDGSLVESISDQPGIIDIDSLGNVILLDNSWVPLRDSTFSTITFIYNGDSSMMSTRELYLIANRTNPFVENIEPKILFPREVYSWVPTITISEVDSASQYNLIISANQFFNPILYSLSGPNNMFTVSNGLDYNTTYYARASTDTNGFGKTTSFLVGEPEDFAFLQEPANNDTVPTFTELTSAPIANATQFVIQLSTDPDFDSIHFEVTSPFRAVCIAGLAPNTRYYNRVRTNLSSGFGKTKSFVTSCCPQTSFVTTPSDGEINVPHSTGFKVDQLCATVTTTYTIELSETSDFSTISFQGSFNNNGSISFPQMKFNTTYYSRVKTNFAPDYGEVRSFTTRPAEAYPVVTYPEDSATGMNIFVPITFKGLPGGASSTYTLQLSDSSDFSSIDYERTYNNPGTVYLDAPLNFSTTYYSRIRANNETSEFGRVKSFTTLSVEEATFVSVPENGAVGVNPVVRVFVKNVPGASQYTIELSDTITFDSIAFTYTGPERSVFTSGLEYGKTYYTRALTDLSPIYGPSGNFSTATLEESMFIKNPIDSAVDLPRSYSFFAKRIPEASEYTIQLSESETFDSIAFQYSGPERNTTFFGMNYNTRYYNRVSTDLTGAYGPVQTFTTIASEDLAFVVSPANQEPDVSTDPVITSNKVPGAAGYTIQLSTTQDFSIINFEESDPTTEVSFSGLLPGTLYYNRVTTPFTTGFGAVNSFTTAGDPPPPFQSTETVPPVQKTNPSAPIINIYPNPFKDQFDVVLLGDYRSEYSVILMDTSGKIILSKNGLNGNRFSFTPQVKRGLYIIRITGENFQRTLKLIKNSDRNGFN